MYISQLKSIEYHISEISEYVLKLKIKMNTTEELLKDYQKTSMTCFRCFAPKQNSLTISNTCIDIIVVFFCFWVI